MLDKHLYHSVSDLISHRGEMVLLDAVVESGADYLIAVVEHRRDHWFTDDEGNTPAWVGLEYMAQTICALAGITSLRKKEPISIGLLLGTRKYTSYVPFFQKDTAVTIKVERVFLSDENLGLFACEIRSDKLLADAQIKGIQPHNIEELMNMRPMR